MAWNPFKKEQGSGGKGSGKSAQRPQITQQRTAPVPVTQSFSGQTGVRRLNSSPIRLSRRIGDIFYATGVVSEADVEEAYRLSLREGILLGRALVSMGKMREGEVLNCLEQQKLVTSVDIGRLSVPPEIIKLVPASLALTHHVLPFDMLGDMLCVCAKSVLNFEAMKAVRDRTRLRVRMFDSLEGYDALKDCMEVYYPVSEQ